MIYPVGRAAIFYDRVVEAVARPTRPARGLPANAIEPTTLRVCMRRCRLILSRLSLCAEPQRPAASGARLSAPDRDSIWRAGLGGRFLVRIEDIDMARSREEYVTGIFEDLAWLGRRWERPVLRQSEHFATTCQAAHRLEAKGLLYPCFASRSEIEAAASPGAVDPDGAPLYPGLHRACRGRISRHACRTASGLRCASTWIERLAWHASVLAGCP